MMKNAPKLTSKLEQLCPSCGHSDAEWRTIPYDAEVRHDGRLYRFAVLTLHVQVCRSCGNQIFTQDTESQINAALRTHLNLLTPPQMSEAIKRLGLSQKEVSERLGIAEATLSRWLNETQIQSRAMDNLLRLFFALPTVRAVLTGQLQAPQLGLEDLPC
jgi:putative zinc finger/helix-turn-helix YgiT family protein